MTHKNVKLTPSAEHIESDAVTVLRANASEFVSLGQAIPMCSLFSSDLTVLKRLSHVLFVDWYLPTMSICCSSSISVCRKDKQTIDLSERENSPNFACVPQRNVMRDSERELIFCQCAKLLSRLYVLRNTRGTPKTLIRRQRSKPLPFDTHIQKRHLFPM